MGQQQEQNIEETNLPPPAAAASYYTALPPSSSWQPQPRTVPIATPFRDADNNNNNNHQHFTCSADHNSVHASYPDNVSGGSQYDTSSSVATASNIIPLKISQLTTSGRPTVPIGLPPSLSAVGGGPVSTSTFSPIPPAVSLAAATFPAHSVYSGTIQDDRVPHVVDQSNSQCHQLSPTSEPSTAPAGVPCGVSQLNTLPSSSAEHALLAMPPQESSSQYTQSQSQSQHHFSSSVPTEKPPEPSAFTHTRRVPFRPPPHTRGRRQTPDTTERYGAIGPALNYILGLDDYGECRTKPGLHQRQHTPPPVVQTAAHHAAQEILGEKVVDNRGIGGTAAVAVPIKGSWIGPLVGAKPGGFKSGYQASDVQRILQSLPFPLRQTSRDTVPARPPKYTELTTTVSTGTVVKPAPSFAPPNAIKLPTISSVSPTRSLASKTGGRDDFLWKLFMPKPPVPHPVESHISAPRQFTSELSKEPIEAAIDKFQVPEEKDQMAIAGEVKQTPDSRLLIIVRRIPDKIYALIRRRVGGKHLLGVPMEEESHAKQEDFATFKLDPQCPPETIQRNELGEAARGKCFNLDMADAESASWVVDRNEFGLDFAPAFPREIKKIVVADPDVCFANLSRDAAVQQRLRASLRAHLAQRNLIPVFIDECEGAEFEKYSEEVLAPIFHYRTPPVSTGFHYLDWHGYQELNTAFLNSIVANYQQGDWLLVLNYQLMLLPKMLRDAPLTREANIGFYLGSVFPSSEMYRIIPQREALLRGVLAATFIGFHGFQYKRHFLTACTRVLGVECSGDRIEPNAAVGGGAGARVVTVPRGINPFPWLKELRKPSTGAKIAELREKLKGRKVLLGIDTLDYTKGIPNKMLAFNKFLTDNPEWANKVVFLQICIPKGPGGYQESTGFDLNGRISRVDRKEILANLYRLVGSINANFGNILTQPVHFLLSPLTVEHLVCLYGLADIAIITPLRESLSWTAYEFVLCQSCTNKGVLILSEFSGSAQSLGAAAICVNPWDPHALAVAIHDALIMTDEEKLERHEYAFDYVLNYDSQSWGHNLLMEFRTAAAEIDTERRTIPPRLDIQHLSKVFQSTTQHIFILGLRGTLLRFSSRGMDPQLGGKARLPKSMELALQILSDDPNTHILIISSSTVSILAQAVAHFPNITIMAENGHFLRPSLRAQAKLKRVPSAVISPAEASSQNSADTGSRRVHRRCTLTEFIPTTAGVDLSWMDPVEEICRYFEQRTPGSFLYRTDTSVAWNYRGAQREYGAIQARDLLIHLWAGPATLTARTDIVVGPHSVEVRSSATSKATAVEKWLRELEDEAEVDLSRSMIFCAANSLPRDEDVFAAILRPLDLATSVHGSICGEEQSEGAGLPSEQAMAPAERDLFLDKVLTCTIGLKPSRADYLISDEKGIDPVLTTLAALTVIRQQQQAAHDRTTCEEKDQEKSVLMNLKDSTPPLESMRSLEVSRKGADTPKGQSQTAVEGFENLMPVSTSTEVRKLLIRELDIEKILASPEMQRSIVASWYNRTHTPLTSGDGAPSSLHTSRRGNGKQRPPPPPRYTSVNSRDARRKSAPAQIVTAADLLAVEEDIEGTDMKSIGAADDEESCGNEEEEEEEEEGREIS